MKDSSTLWPSLFCGALLLGSLAWCASASALPGEVSFTPSGLRLSVMRIVLSATDANGNPTAQAALYTCENAAEADCLVDVTNQSELDAIAAAAGDAKVDVGTYDTVSLEMCAAGKPGGANAPGYVRGSFTIESEHKTYATTAEEGIPLGLKEVAEDDATGGEFTAIGNWACSTKSVRLPAPVEVKEGVPTDLTVVMDKSLIAFSTPNVSGGMGGCRGQENGQARGFCVSYPSIVPLVGEATPSFDRFLLAHHRTDAALIDDSKANAYVVVVSSAEGDTPLTAFVRPYYSETSAQASSNMSYDEVFGGPGYFGETLISSVNATADGGIDFTTGGSLDGNAAIFADFKRMNDRGVVQTRELGSWQYHAFPILP
jgi:hypothetical protein